MKRLLYSTLLCLTGLTCTIALLLCACSNSDSGSPPPPPPATTNAAASPIEEIPSFPWPPPEASALANLPRQFFTNAHSLRDVESKLSAALAICDYPETSYYAVPGGFALVTRIEQINPDGTSKPPPGRWAITAVHSSKFTLADYLKALFKANPGTFRIIVFIVSNQPFTQTGAAVTRDEAMKWLPGGANRLPSSLGDQPYTSDHTCTALVYEFQLPETKDEATLAKPSPLTGEEHLAAAQLWKHLAQ